MLTRKKFFFEIFLQSSNLVKELFFEPEQDDSLNNPPHESQKNSNDIFTDFPDDVLYTEAMRLGIDPATMDRNKLLQIIKKEMINKKQLLENDDK